MKKFNIIIALLLCSLCCLTVYADNPSIRDSASTAVLGDSDVADIETNTTTVASNEEASNSSTSNVETAKEERENSGNTNSTDNDGEENTGLATLPNGPAYVGVYSNLKLRDAVWGNIVGELYNNEEVTITGRDGDWYQVTTSKGSGYCHARYVFAEPDKRYYGDDPTNPSAPSGSSSGVTSGVKSDVVLNVSGDSVQGKVVSAAQSLVDNYSTSGSFPYAPATNGGNLGCAQVVTTALVAAGVLPARSSSGGLGYASLGCSETISLLNQAGWTAVQAPPYQAGDVIFWQTYRSGPSHVGIVMTSGNSATAMSNSSSKHKPRLHDAEYNGAYPVVKVMRQL